MWILLFKYSQLLQLCEEGVFTLLYTLEMVNTLNHAKPQMHCKDCQPNSKEFLWLHQSLKRSRPGKAWNSVVKHGLTKSQDLGFVTRFEERGREGQEEGEGRHTHDISTGSKRLHGPWRTKGKTSLTRKNT